MLHIVRLLERRFPAYARRMIPALLLVTLLALAAGISLFAAR